MKTALEWALRHLDLGYCPIPISPESKVACIKWKPWQEATPEISDLEAWFSVPGRNLGLLTGRYHRLVVIDADDEDSVKFSLRWFPKTPYRVRTRRGMHFYFQHPGVHVANRAGIIPGYKIDIRGDGGLVVGLGSVHPSGFVYHLDDGAELTPVFSLPIFCPEWIPKREIIRPEPNRRDFSSMPELERAGRYLDKCPGFTKGTRNQGTFKLAAFIIRDIGLPVDQGIDLLLAFNASKNDPPLPDHEIVTIVNSAARS